MSLEIHLTGHVQAEDEAQAAGVEQQMSDELVAFVKRYAEWIDYGEATFQFAENLDLAAIATDHVENPTPVPPPPTEVPTGTGGSTEVPTPPPGNETGHVDDPPADDQPVIDDEDTPVIEVPPDETSTDEPSEESPFMLKLADEDYASYVIRAEAVGVTPGTEEEWNALAVGATL